MNTVKDLPESTKQVIYKVGFFVYLSAIAVLIVLATMSTGCAQKRPIVNISSPIVNIPADPVVMPTPIDNTDSLVDRGLGFYDGCIAAGKKPAKCEKLATAYVENLKSLVN